MKMKTEFGVTPECLTLNSTHNLFRYISEWDPRAHAKTKGGYLEGQITVPEQLLGSPLHMVIQTHPNECIEASGDNFHQRCAHPGLVHVVRMGRGRRENEKEPVPNHQHWRQQFIINNGEVKIVNTTSALDENREHPIPREDLVTRLNGNKITLGRKNGELNLIILQPKTSARAAEGEATVRKVIQQRIGVDDKETLDKYENQFKGKNSLNMKRVRLLINFFRIGDNFPISSLSSQTILDTGNKDIGAMDFYDATPLKSCAQGGRKVIMVSEYSLSKDVEPIYQVWDDTDQHREDMDELLAQPSQFSIKKESIIFITPPQHNFKALQGMKIKLAVKRKIDGYVSNNKFSFGYVTHHEGQCIFCNYSIDTDRVEGFAQLAPEIPRSKPGTKKRQMLEETNVTESKVAKTLWNGSPPSPNGSVGSIDSGHPDSPRSPEGLNFRRPSAPSPPASPSSQSIFINPRPSVIMEGPPGSVPSDPYPIDSINIDPMTNWNIPPRVACMMKDTYNNKQNQDLLGQAINENQIIPTTVSTMETQPMHAGNETVQFVTGSLQENPISNRDIENSLNIQSSAMIAQNQQIQSIGSEIFPMEIPQENITIQNQQIESILGENYNDASSQGLFLDIENLQMESSSQLFIETPQTEGTPMSPHLQECPPPGVPRSPHLQECPPSGVPRSPHLQECSTNPLLSTGGQINLHVRRTFLEERETYQPDMDSSTNIMKDCTALQGDDENTLRKRDTGNKHNNEKIVHKRENIANEDADENTNNDGIVGSLLQYSRFFTLSFIFIFIALQFVNDYFNESVNEGHTDEESSLLSPVQTVIVSLGTALVFSFINSNMV